jgi:hypothetical protein
MSDKREFYESMSKDLLVGALLSRDALAKGPFSSPPPEREQTAGEQLEKLRELSEKATGGEWSTRGLSDHVRIERVNSVGKINVARCGSSQPGLREPESAEVWSNANYITALVNWHRSLLTRSPEAKEPGK